MAQIRGADGLPEAGVEVEFQAEDASMYVSAVGEGPSGRSAVVETDPQGRATARIRYGGTAGPAGITIEVPLYGLTASASYTVLPGAAAGVTITPRDTTVVLGSNWTVRAAVVDRRGNAREDPLSLDVDPLRFGRNGQSLTALGYGKGWIRAQAEIRIEGEDTMVGDSTGAAVVPAGTVAWVPRRQPLHVGELTGEAERVGEMEAIMPAWSPDGTAIAFVNGGLLYLHDSSGTERRIDTGDVNAIAFPVFSPDGAWIYFTGSSPEPYQTIHRVRPDGSEMERVIQGEGVWPTLSPDGEAMAYRRGDSELVVRDLETGNEKALLADAFEIPRWSPSGEWIAYVRRFGGELMLVEPDGTGGRQVGDHGLEWEDGISWSPDGRWIVGFDQTATLVDVQSETMLDLAWGRRPSPGIAWMP